MTIIANRQEMAILLVILVSIHMTKTIFEFRRVIEYNNSYTKFKRNPMINEECALE